MHIVGPGLTTTKYNSKGKKVANTAKARKAKMDHDAWLRGQGLHPEQLELQKAFKGQYRNSLPDLTVNSHIPVGNNLAVDGGYRHSVMDNLHHESSAIRKEILDKARRIAPAFSKGAYQYITPGSDLTDIGKKK
jgi:hypothetical protein